MVTLRRLAAAEVDDIAGAGEAVARNFDAVFGTGEDGGRVGIRLSRLAVEDEAGAGFRTRMLRDKEDARVGALGGGTVAEPSGERDTKRKFRCDGSEVEDDGAEASAMEEEIGGAESLIQPGVRLARLLPLCSNRSRGQGAGYEVWIGLRVTGSRLRHNFLAVLSDFWHRLTTAG